jgi:asparagine synthase (glutamine-hydrolysing)
MAGICGLFKAMGNGAGVAEEIGRMVTALGSRARGAPAVFADPGRVVLAARARRADAEVRIHANPDGTRFIVCDGQVYNADEVRGWLEGRGRSVESDDGAELLLHLYDEEGPDGFRRADGHFALAIWDRPRDRLILARDPLGGHPLYYTPLRGGLAFASEIRVLLQHPEVALAYDSVGVSHYLTFLTVPAPRTLFAGISKLPPGHTATAAAPGTVSLRRYWDLLDRPIPERDDERFYVERVRELHRRSLGRRVGGVGGPIAALLSGGNDSSANAALIARGAPGPLHTFTVGLDEVEGDPAHTDLYHARRVSEHIGSTHHQRLLSVDQFLDTIPVAVEALDDLVSEPSCVFLHHALKLAREQGLEVVITGEANDELCCGHDEMITIRNGYYCRWRPFMRLPRAARRLIAAVAPAVWPRRRDILRRAAEGGEYFWSFEIAWPEAEMAEVLTEAGLARAAGERAADVVARYRARLDASAHRRRDYLDYIIYMMMQDFYFGNLMLGKLDLLAARLGLDARCPYAAPEYAHFVYNIPAELKLRGGTVKYFFKKAIEGLLPREIIYRPKQGFRTPVIELFQGRLGDWAAPHLFEEGLTREGFVRRGHIERLLRRHRAGGADHSNKLWTIMALNLWHQRWIVSGRDAGVACASAEQALRPEQVEALVTV